MHNALSGTRHLLYHIYPLKGRWQLAAEQLKQRLSLFNGQKIIGIAHDSRCDPHEAVRELLGDADYFVMPNKKSLREVQTWRDLWRRLRHSPGDAVFYAQAKGVTRPKNPGVTCHPWGSMMLEVLLDYYPVVERALQTHPIVGMARKPGGFGGYNCHWHFSGSYFWTTQVRDWNTIWAYKYGVEAWPGSIFKLDESHSIFLDGDLDLYSPEKFHEYTQELKSFRLDHRDDCLWRDGGEMQSPAAAR